mgnify:CR=1 FL=1
MSNDAETEAEATASAAEALAAPQRYGQMRRAAEAWTDAEAEAEAARKQAHGRIGLQFVGLSWIVLECGGSGCN